VKLYFILIFVLINSFLFAVDPTVDINDIMNEYKVTAAFGDSRDDHLHTGVDLAATDQEIRSVKESELIFYNKDRIRSIPYGTGNFVILENSKDKVRFNYSHLKDGTFNPKKIVYKKTEVIAVNGNSGHSTGNHLHVEVEDVKDNKILNPFGFLKLKDTQSPRIDDVYFVTKNDKKISLWTNNKIKRGGRLYIKCIDRINGSNYDIIPYKITVIIDGKEKHVLTFDYFKKTENSFTISNTGLKFEDIYVNKESYDFYLFEFNSLPDLIGMKIIVEDFAGNKSEFKKAIEIQAPETETKKSTTGIGLTVTPDNKQK
jgi:hypothetical protein